MSYELKHITLLAVLLLSLAIYVILKTPSETSGKAENQQNSVVEFTLNDCLKVYPVNPFSMISKNQNPYWPAFGLDLPELEPNHTQQQEIEVYAKILEYINKTFEYQKDTENTWKTPTQLLRDGGGDCEDFTLAFICYSLEAGIESNKFRINFALVDCSGTEGYHYYPEVRIQHNGEEVWLPIEVTKNKDKNNLKTTDPTYYLNNTYPSIKDLCWMNESMIGTYPLK